ncbi:hypothetical protein V8C26DRAFT_369733 [Trichoderma gracile]
MQRRRRQSERMMRCLICVCVCVCACLKWIPNGLRVSLMRCPDSGSGKDCSLFVVDGPFVCCAFVAVLRVSVQAEALVGMVNLQSTLAVLCKAAKSAAGYQSHQQSLGTS